MILTLTEAGRKTFAAADAAARAQVDALLLPVGQPGRERLADAMRDIRLAQLAQFGGRFHDFVRGAVSQVK